MGVVIEYKGQNRMRIVESAAERRAREHRNAKRISETVMINTLTGMDSSIEREGTHRPWYYCGLYTDTKSWKNQKHARRPWMRHLHRLTPSVHNLVDNCIYPNVNSF